MTAGGPVGPWPMARTEAEQAQDDTGHMLYDFIYMNYPEKVDLRRVGQWLSKGERDPWKLEVGVEEFDE